MIRVTEGKLHWNYYLALERDMEQVSRYIEFCEDNFPVYSIELAHLLFAAAAEVDVVAKALCKLLDHSAPRNTIEHYRALIPVHFPQFFDEKIFIPRYGLTLNPWENWGRDTSPLWWRSYNNVKHQRHEHFQEANLKNALNGLSALLVVIFYYYTQYITKEEMEVPIEKDVTKELEPQSILLRLNDNYYDSHLIV